MVRFFILLCSLPIMVLANEGIWVEGNADVSMKPDVANVSLTVSTLDKSASKAQALNAKISDEIFSVVKKYDVAGKDIQTSSFNLSTEYDYQNRNRVFKGHRVSHSLIIQMRNTEKLGKLLDDLTAKSSDSLAINNISFSLSEDHKFKLKALDLAVQNAKEKAQVLSKSADKKLGKIKAIEELTQGGSMPMVRMEKMAAFGGAADTNIQTGEVGVSVKLKVHFELE